MIKNLLYKLLLVGTDNQPDLTVGGPKIEFENFESTLCIILILIIVIGGGILAFYIQSLKDKIDELQNKNNPEKHEEEHE